MDYDEHHRLRLVELQAHHQLKHVHLAALIDVTPDYVSRLLYIPGKKGRKNLGPALIRKLCTAFNLPPGWFDLPLGQALSTDAPAPLAPAPTNHKAQEWAHEDKLEKPREPVEWPFKIVTYQRIQNIRKHFGARGMPPALSDIDKHLDVLVTRWENEITKNKSAAA